MDEDKAHLPPMTREQLEAEAAYAERIFERLRNEPLERTREILRRGRRSKAASLVETTGLKPAKS